MLAFRRRKTPSRGLHHALVTVIDGKRAVLRTALFVFNTRNNNISVECVSGAQSYVLNLVANRARYAISGKAIVLVLGIQRQMRENLGSLALRFGHQVRHRHVAGGALILQRGRRFWMVDGFAAHAALPVWIAGRISHDAGAPQKAD